MTNRRRALASCLLVLVLALLGGAARSSSTTPPAAGPATFTDPAGDAGGAPDLTSIAIDSITTTGTVELSVTASGVTAMAAAEPAVLVYLDTDKNPSTGSPSGCEYRLSYWLASDDWGWWTERWTGSMWEEWPLKPTMSFVRSGDTLTWRFGKTDIGDATGFNFYVASASNANGTPASDYAPDAGFWIYDLPVLVVQPTIARPVTSPVAPVAGKTFVVKFPVTRSDNGQPLTVGTMVCDPSVNGKVLKHAESFVRGTAKLSFLVPKATKGKQLKVKVTIKATGGAATRVSTFRIK